MLHQGLEIKGGRVYLPNQFAELAAIVKTEDAVWAWHPTDGSYFKITIEDGVPKTEAYVTEEKAEPSAFKTRLWDRGM